MGVLTNDDSQIIFTDTPGLHTPQNKLDEFMMESINSARNDSDISLVVIDHKTEPIPHPPQNAWLVINKIDSSPKEQILPLISQYQNDFEHIFPASAKTGEGVEELLSHIRATLPEGPRYFAEDTLTDQPERVIIAEFIREKAIRLLGEELPYGIAVEIGSMKPDAFGTIHVQATIFCEKNSHKAMIIGKKGEKIKQIGTLARQEAEKFLGHVDNKSKIYLELWVKVRPNWRNNQASLRSFGYE
jgi:GTP-binding protein Era